MRAAESQQVFVGTWLLFGAIVVVSLTIDLVAHRGGRGRGRTSAVAWSIVWIVAALLFAGYIAIALGTDSAGSFVSAWLIEKSLSVDNLFVFMIVFARLKIPTEEQHRVLFWGIIGALVARALFIAGGTALLGRWHDVVYVLGAFLIVTGIKTWRAGPLQSKGDSRALEWLREHLPVVHLEGHRFFAREDGQLKVTALLVALLAIEVSDIMFAIDSVPAVFAVTEDPFIVYSSNVFAILGLRALYLVLADLLKDLRYLHYGLAAILVLAGTKMLVSKHVQVPAYVSLFAIVTILIFAIVPSLIVKSLRRARARAHHARP